jgi:hypothetical protein
MASDRLKIKVKSTSIVFSQPVSPPSFFQYYRTSEPEICLSGPEFGIASIEDLNEKLQQLKIKSTLV